MIARRNLVGTVVTGLGLLRAPRRAAAQPKHLTDALRGIETTTGGRLGVAMLDTQTGERQNYRGDERFPMCSTFKVLAASLVLARVDAYRDSLHRRIRVEKADLVPYSPVTERHIGGDGMSLAELCAAALNFSDNTAANLLLASFGGPPALTSFARTLGDPLTRLDRTEPDLNESLPGDPRDTTTPLAMLSNLNALLIGSALSDQSRKQLIDWLLGNRTGDARIRAGVPDGWRVGDKTGSGDRGSTNDVGILLRPEQTPVLLCIYLTATSAPMDRRNAAIAAAAHTVASAIGP